MYRLLIVDEDRDACESLRVMVDWAGLGISGIQTARTFPEALSRAVDFRPQLALVHGDLPGDGFALVRELRSMGLGIVCCMMSAGGDFSKVSRAFEAGARGYLLKPVDREALKDFAERAIVWELHGRLPAEPAPRNLDPVLGVGYEGFSSITNKLILMVKTDYRSSLALTGIAETLRMSSKYMGRVFLRDTGMKFSEYLMAYRMLRARALIEGTREKISVIAGMVGYSQINNFYVHFKGYWGFSPSALRGKSCQQADESALK